MSAPLDNQGELIPRCKGWDDDDDNAPDVPGQRNAKGNYIVNRINKEKAPDCTMIGAIARNFLRLRTWRHGIAVSVVPYHKTPNLKLLPHLLYFDSFLWGVAMLITFLP